MRKNGAWKVFENGEDGGCAGDGGDGGDGRDEVPKVIAFADYSTHEEAVRAVEEFHEAKILDRHLRCHLTVPSPWEGAIEWYPGRTWAKSNSKHVYIGNCPYDTRPEDLHTLFSNLGECAIHSTFRLPKGVAFVQYGSHEDALLAVERFHEFVQRPLLTVSPS